MRFKDEVRQSLSDIKAELVKNTIATEKNTYVLNEHHVRHSNLEARFKPVEKHVLVVHSLAKIGLSLLTGAAALAAVFHFFFSK